MRVTCVPAPMYFSSVSKLGYDISFKIADFSSNYSSVCWNIVTSVSKQLSNATSLLDVIHHFS